MQMSSVKTFEEMERGNTRLEGGSESYSKDDLQRKVNSAVEFLEKTLRVFKKPVCLCSFGKDSLVLLHLINRVKKVPVIYWREPYFQSKFTYPQEIADKWDLEIYDYPPSFTNYLQIDDYFDVYNFYYINGIDYINLYTGIRKFKEGEKYLCALNDLLLRPKVPSYTFNWDCIFHGHKQCDPVYIADRIEIPLAKIFGNGLLAMPIKDWTNEDIWAYIKEYDLPYNKTRYDDKSEINNNDVFPTCYNCLDYRESNPFCPKKGKCVASVSKGKEANEVFRKQLLGLAYK